MDEKMFEMPHKKETAVDTVVNRIRDLIFQRKLKPGDLIPSEGVLAESMGVSRGSIREAMKILTALGVVDIRRGDGTYISCDIGRTLLDPFLLRLVMSEPDRRQMVEFREMIECDVARAAVGSRNEEGIEAMRRAVGRMRDSLGGGNEASARDLAALDIEFHKAMGRATGNVLISQLYEFVLQFFEPSIQQTYSHPDNVAQALAYHSGILAALEGGDEKMALLAVQLSIQGWMGQEEEPC